VSDAVPDAVSHCIRVHQSASLDDQKPVQATPEANRKPLENKQPGAVLHRVASVCFELPGLDSNQDKENQNPHTPRRKPKPHKAVTPGAVLGCSAGCSSQRSEGGILDADLAVLIAAWPTLPEHVRATIRTLVESQRRTDR
jgi:hypothetical protein